MRRCGILLIRMKLFRKNKQPITQYDPEIKKPIIKASICNGEQVAGFKDLRTGAFEEVMLIRNEADLIRFKHDYGIDGTIEKVY